MLSNLIAFFIEAAILGVFWIYYKFFTAAGVHFGTDAVVLLVPLLLVQVTAVSAGAGLIVASCTAKYRDLRHVLPRRINDSWTQLGPAHAINLTGTVRVIELAQALKIPRMVYASSAAVYGDATSFPIAETQRLQPLSPYGLQKFASEEYGRLLARENLTFVAQRFFNVFGPRQVAGSPYSGVITKFATAMRANGPITIFGGGVQTRDFVYLQDIATGIALALQANGLEPFTVGSAVSITQLAEAMRAFFPEWKAGFREAAAPARGHRALGGGDRGRPPSPRLSAALQPNVGVIRNVFGERLGAQTVKLVGRQFAR